MPAATIFAYAVDQDADGRDSAAVDNGTCEFVTSKEMPCQIVPLLLMPPAKFVTPPTSTSPIYPPLLMPPAKFITSPTTKRPIALLLLIPPAKFRYQQHQRSR